MNQTPSKLELRRPWKRWSAITLLLRTFGLRHRRWFVIGAFSSLWIVALRLILPWPLRALMEPSLSEASGKSAGLLSMVPEGFNPTLVMSALFLIIILLLGLMDYVARLCFARYAIGLTRDLRAEAFRSARNTESSGGSKGTGDLVARLIGDTARLKAGLKGFLVHVATNGALFVGVTLIVLWIDRTMGLIFVATILLIGMATILGARAMYAMALKFRTKEGKLADFIQDSWDNQALTDFADVNESSGRHEAALTQIQGRTTWFAHVVLGVGIVAALAYGATAVANQELPAGDLLILAMYALMIRAPVVQLSRQGARTGKILACGDRLVRLVTSSTAEAEQPLAPLQESIRIEGAKVSIRRAKTRIRRLGPIDISIESGQRIAVLGKPGSGKTTLLEVLGGALQLRKGTYLWDGRNITGSPSLPTLSGQAVMLPNCPTWAPRRVRELLGTEGDTIDANMQELLRVCGATSLLKRLPTNMNAKLEASTLSPRERVAIGLVTLLRGDASLWLLDDPIASLEKQQAKKILKKILSARPGTTIVIAMSRPVNLKLFDRVIEMQRGRVCFDGPPAAWRALRKPPACGLENSELATGDVGS